MVEIEVTFKINATTDEMIGLFDFTNFMKENAKAINDELKQNKEED